MQVNLVWHPSIKLPKKMDGCDYELIPQAPGIYIFLRIYGEDAEALYVGKSENIRRRIKQQFNNRRLMDAIKDARNGERRLVFAEFAPKKGKMHKNALEITEETFISHYLALGHGLVNIKGTRLRHHEIRSERGELKQFLPISAKLHLR
ncbi:GIY-YIG nuclease family protein [Lysobacter hankyongensis]|uniref:GIY-YIG domain-containing protein n=1 Tax=Lysobacter hankyongensis TaxID=1176535 RepID=A0ABP9CB37_9GAMM